MSNSRRRVAERFGHGGSASGLLGFEGKWAIHPDQAPMTNEMFTPSDAEVAEAHQIMSDYRRWIAPCVGLTQHGRQ